MRTLAIVAVLALSTMPGLMQAQQSPLRRDADARRLRLEAETLRERARQASTACPLPDGSIHPLNAVVTYEGQTYRCVEVFTPTPPPQVPPGENQTLTVRMAGWVKVP